MKVQRRHVTMASRYNTSQVPYTVPALTMLQALFCTIPCH